jgi:hypothetical protein
VQDLSTQPADQLPNVLRCVARPVTSTRTLAHSSLIRQHSTAFVFPVPNHALSRLRPSHPRCYCCSISYAWYELDQCDISPGVAPCENQPVPAGSAIFVNAVNQLFAKAAARGVTLVAASGDSGSHGRTDPSCTNPTTRAGASYGSSDGQTRGS